MTESLALIPINLALIGFPFLIERANSGSSFFVAMKKWWLLPMGVNIITAFSILL